MQIIEILDHDTTSRDQSPAVGIDFGTTHSLIAVVLNDKPHVISEIGKDGLLPSIIAWDINGKFEIGSHSDGSIYSISSIKRLFGKSTVEIINTPFLLNLVRDVLDSNNTVPKINVAGKLLTIAEVASEIFKYLKSQATKYLNMDLSKAVITVPAYFDDAAKGEVMLAAKLAGFEIIRLIAEPTASAYAYGFNKQQKGCYLVYDFGGGTFDVSILNMQAGILQVIATNGDNLLGGDDIDLLITDYLQYTYKLPTSQKLIKFAKKLKEELSRKDKVISNFEGDISIEIDNLILANLVSPLLEQTKILTQEAISAAGDYNLDGIILVGGTTRMPLVKALLERGFHVPVFTDIDPDKAVVYGAALQAHNLTQPIKNTLLIDVAPLSIGLELYGGINEKIILRNTPIPVSITQEFTTYADNQTAMQFHIIQGEREMADDCRSLAKFELKNIPPMKSGMPRIEVTFSIDADGILSVSALEQITGTVQLIEIKPTHGLDADEINNLLTNAYKNAERDHNARLLQETIITAQTLLVDLEKAIKEIPAEKLYIISSTQEINAINKAMEDLKISITTNNREVIINNINALKNLSSNFITNKLNYAISGFLKNKNIDEIDS